MSRSFPRLREVKVEVGKGETVAQGEDGEWISTARNCRSACRNRTVAAGRFYGLGLRLAMSVCGDQLTEAGT